MVRWLLGKIQNVISGHPSARKHALVQYSFLWMLFQCEWTTVISMHGIHYCSCILLHRVLQQIEEYVLYNSFNFFILIFTGEIITNECSFFVIFNKSTSKSTFIWYQYTCKCICTYTHCTYMSQNFSELLTIHIMFI